VPTIRRRRPLWRAALAAAVGLIVAGCAPGFTDGDSQSPSIPISPRPTPTTTASNPPPAPEFDRAARSIDDPASSWVVVNKLRPLNPIDYSPADLVTADVPATNPATVRAEVADALVALFAAARAEAGIELQSLSAYRSYATQATIYANGVAANGVEYTEQFSARPGHSEHQTGFAVDIGVPGGECAFQACFGELPAGLWLAENAHRFGFLVRYPEGAISIVGFAYEPWHFRYIGIDLAAEMRQQGVATLEEFFGLPPAPDYAD
jgi:zinc D-Ala-D-Ala carboxypeptidase